MSKLIPLNPILTISRKAKAALGQHILMAASGGLPAAGGRVLGPTRSALAVDEVGSVYAGGVVPVVSAGAIADGADLMTDAAGKVTTHAGNVAVIGQALEAATAADQTIMALIR